MDDRHVEKELLARFLEGEPQRAAELVEQCYFRRHWEQPVVPE